MEALCNIERFNFQSPWHGHSWFDIGLLYMSSRSTIIMLDWDMEGCTSSKHNLTFLQAQSFILVHEMRVFCLPCRFPHHHNMHDKRRSHLSTMCCCSTTPVCESYCKLSWWVSWMFLFAVRSLQVCANYNNMFLWVQEDLHLAQLGPLPSPFVLHPVMISAGLLFLPLKGKCPASHLLFFLEVHHLIFEWWCTHLLLLLLSPHGSSFSF